MIKYGELSTKKNNINYFVRVLRNNVEIALRGLDVNIMGDRNRMFISSSNLDLVVSKLTKVFGIHELDVVYKLDGQDFNELYSNVVDCLKEESFKTFKVETKRSDKRVTMDSMEISRRVGGCILKNISNISVDVRNPELLLNVEVRSDALYFYYKKIKGIGGYPVGTLGKGMLMLSGGIDSPVAGYLAIKRGIKLEALYFESPPHTSLDAKNKVLELAKKLSLYNNGVKVHVINFTKIQEAIYKNIPHEYLITIMRRMMYRIGAILTNRRNGHVLVNGESIGQVASQTLTSMRVINEVVKLPVIRPVACFDKLEIIDLAKKIGTYETSILPFEDCCTIFVPEHPVINPELDKCYEYEKLIDYEEMIYEAIKNHEVIDVVDQEEMYNDLL